MALDRTGKIKIETGGMLLGTALAALWILFQEFDLAGALLAGDTSTTIPAKPQLPTSPIPPFSDLVSAFSAGLSVALISFALTSRLPWFLLLFIAPITAALTGFSLDLAAASAKIPFYGQWSALTVFAGLAAAAATRAAVRAPASFYLSRNLKGRIDPKQLRSLIYTTTPPALHGETKKMTLLHCALRDADLLADRYRNDPEALSHIVRSFVSTVSDEIRHGGGTIVEVTGAGITAAWNAITPCEGHEHLATECATNLILKLDNLNESLEAFFAIKDNSFCSISFGIGVNTGHAVTGDLGTKETPLFTAVGEAVDIAKRLGQTSRIYGPAILLGSHTASAVHNSYALLEIDQLAVSSNNPPLKVFALLGNPVTKASPSFQAMQNAYGRVFEAFRAQNWQKAREALAECQDLSGGHPNLYTLYAERIDFLETNAPGSSWDGAIRNTVH